MTVSELDDRFNQLSNVTDQVALMNSPYDSDLDSAFSAMEGIIDDCMTWDLDTMASDARRVTLSHLSFHREIVAEIITEARRQLIEERRPYLKRLVNYHKSFAHWFGRLEKMYAA